MEQEVKDYLQHISPRWRARKLADHPRWSEWIRSRYPSYGLAHGVQFLMDGLEREPRCQVCDGVLKLPHHATCSTRCRDELKRRLGQFSQARQKAQATMMERYGVANAAHSQEFQARRLNTMTERYGAGASPRARALAQQRARDMNLKGRQTMLERYRVENPGQLPDHRAKCQSTLMSKHGVTNFFHSQEWADRRAETVENRWQQYSPVGITVEQVISPTASQTLERIRFRCDGCGGEHVAPTEAYKWRIRQTGTPCPSCGGINQGSLKVRALAGWVRSLGVEVITNCRTTLGNGQELDIVIPEHGLAIEFNGLFWHNDLRLPPRYHLDKLELAQAAGLRLITVFEDEWDHHPELVKSRIVNGLGLGQKRVGARQCQVRVVTTPEARAFIDQNHLQGYTPSRAKLGLEHQGQLMAVMTFSGLSRAKGHRSRSNHWELSRFCSLAGVNVTGGASRLFKHFVEVHCPEMVLSFADRRWGDGAVYQSLGFQSHGATDPGYWYIRGSQRIHRYRLRKNSGDDPNKTERENRLAQGYLRIWDCGHARWVWTREKAQLTTQ